MPKLLCEIEDCFHLHGRGTIIVLPPRDQWRIPEGETVHQREAIRLYRPDKSSTRTFAKSFDHISGRGFYRHTIELPKDVFVEHAPEGTLVFLEREDDKPILWDGTKTSHKKDSDDKTVPFGDS